MNKQDWTVSSCKLTTLFENLNLKFGNSLWTIATLSEIEYDDRINLFERVSNRRRRVSSSTSDNKLEYEVLTRNVPLQ